ncbi:DinB family protein [Phycicoccus ginsengisoli]
MAGPAQREGLPEGLPGGLPPRQARTFRDEQLLGATFEHVDLSGARFDRVDLTGARLQMVDLADAEVRDTAFRNVRLRGVELHDVEINGELENVRVNGVDIGPLVSAELDRLHPERTRLRPTDPQGYREAWAVLEDLWTGTVERARRLEAVDPGLLHEGVDGEWSFVETLRHLAFATSSWLRRALLGDPSPWHPLELPWDTMPDTPGVPRDREVRPSLDEALELRLARSSEVAAYLATLTDEQLAGRTDPLAGTGWPPEGSQFPVKDCLDVLLNEEWWHRQFAERDLAVLKARQEEKR